MTTSQISSLSEPVGTNKVPRGTLAYFRARLKHRVYSLVLKEFKKSGLTQADLARRLGKEPAQVCRMLSGPGNLTLDSVSDLLFSTSGAELGLSTAYPLRAPQRNATQISSDPSKPVTRSSEEPAKVNAKLISNNPDIKDVRFAA
jgi:hypothetical protein